MPLGREAVEKVFHLSRITPKEGEIEMFSSQLDAVLDYMATLNKLDTGSIEPVNNISNVSTVFRDDVCLGSITVEKVLANAPLADEESFKVPKVF